MSIVPSAWAAPTSKPWSLRACRTAARARRLPYPWIAGLCCLLLSACAALPLAGSPPAQRSTALATPQDTTLGQQAQVLAAGQEGRSAFRILTRGVEGFLARAHLIANAERTLDLQYYIFRQDDTGQLLTELLLKAADRGVRVRLLLDDGETEAGDEQLELLAAHPMIEVRVFNPFRYRGHLSVVRLAELLLSGGRLDFRMHNKLLVADNGAALVGGRNIGDQYFQVDPDSQFGDDDVLTFGPLVTELSASFDDFWNSGMAAAITADQGGAISPARLAGLRTRLVEHHQRLARRGLAYVQALPAALAQDGLTPLAQGSSWAHATLVYDSPDKRRVERGDRRGRLMHPKVAAAVAAVNEELLMITPYLIPGADGMALFGSLRERKVRVKILTNSLVSSPELVAHAGYVPYRPQLLGTGVELFEVRNAPGDARGIGETAAMARHGHYALHAKLFVLDRRRLFIGSMNFDQRSLMLNTEIGLIIDSPELAQSTAARFEAIVTPDNSYALALAPTSPGSETAQIIWRTRQGGQMIEFRDEPAYSTWQRLKLDWLKLLPLDSEL